MKWTVSGLASERETNSAKPASATNHRSKKARRRCKAFLLICNTLHPIDHARTHEGSAHLLKLKFRFWREIDGSKGPPAGGGGGGRRCEGRGDAPHSGAIDDQHRYRRC